MIQLSADISALTVEQRKAVAAFILDFPQPINSRDIHSPIANNEDETVIIPSFTAASEDDEQSPEAAFAPSPVISNIPQVVSGPVLVPAPPTSDTATPLDKNGIPWDERIHSSSRVKTADGSWRMKRGVDEALAASVTSELKALMNIPAPPVAAVIPPPPPVVAATVPAPPVVADKQAFIALISKASSAMQAKKLTQDELTQAVNAAGVPKLELLGNRMDLVPVVSATLDAIMLGR